MMTMSVLLLTSAASALRLTPELAHGTVSAVRARQPAMLVPPIAAAAGVAAAAVAMRAMLQNEPQSALSFHEQIL